MALLLFRSEAECLASEHTNRASQISQPQAPDRSRPYRASGLVLWTSAVRLPFSESVIANLISNLSVHKFPFRERSPDRARKRVRFDTATLNQSISHECHHGAYSDNGFNHKSLGDASLRTR